MATDDSAPAPATSRNALQRQKIARCAFEGFAFGTLWFIVAAIAGFVWPNTVVWSIVAGVVFGLASFSVYAVSRKLDMTRPGIGRSRRR